MRLVLDTNIVIAALLWKGAPHQLFGLITEGRASCFSSAELLSELERALQYPKFAQQFKTHSVTPQVILERYTRLARLVVSAEISSTVLADPDDDQVLACALAAQADLVVSGDADLLDLKTYQGIPIISAAQALVRISETSTGN